MIGMGAFAIEGVVSGALAGAQIYCIQDYTGLHIL